MSALRNVATGPGPITDDGCAVELYRRLQPAGEPEIVHAHVPPGATILELGAGVGRVTHALVRLGHAVTAVDSSAPMLAHIEGADTVLARIEQLALGRTFGAVLLGSNLINVPDPALRLAFMNTARRHVARDGIVLIERYVPSRLTRLAEGLLEDQDGIRCSLRAIRRENDAFSATLVYETRDATWTHSFSATLLDDVAIAALLEAAQLKFFGWLDDETSWLGARPTVFGASSSR